CGEGPDGRKQEYDWERIYATIERLQPDAVTAVMGRDVRWVGNEGGLGRTTEWSATVLAPGGAPDATGAKERLGLTSMSPDLGSRDILAQADAVYWWPSEVDVSIRPGWCYHDYQDAQVKSLRQLVDIYYIPPDRRGRIHASDSVRLQELAAYLDRTFSDDRLEGGDRTWRPRAGESREYDLKPGSRINTVLLQEEIARGQRVEEFTVEVLADEGWTEVARGTTIGYKRLIRIPETEASKLRITVDGTRLRARISKVGAYLAPSLVETTAATDDGMLPREAWSVRRAQPLTVDMGEPYRIAGFVYAPGEASPEVAYKYRFEVSADGEQWIEAVADGEFSNMMYNAEPRRVVFDKPLAARYFRLTASTVSGDPAKVAMEHIGIVK
ncbi:MAG: discoidin domain-containing protein, partial [Alistipes sp.]|nr:discoidin domain-containing protein [Alistipes sp.]